jgi:hypothetical protein
VVRARKKRHIAIKISFINGYGQWTPKAYTLCLPYEFRFGELVEPGKVKFYQLSFVDADGTSRYFDLQGRLLNGKPLKGLYLNNSGKKVIIN